jgi:hypothetical protein
MLQANTATAGAPTLILLQQELQQVQIELKPP